MRHIITDNPNYYFDEKQYEEEMRANMEEQRKRELAQKQENINRYIDQIQDMIDKRTYTITTYGTFFLKYKYKFQFGRPFVRWYNDEVRTNARKTYSELRAVANILEKKVSSWNVTPYVNCSEFGDGGYGIEIVCKKKDMEY